MSKYVMRDRLDALPDSASVSAMSNPVPSAPSATTGVILEMSEEVTEIDIPGVQAWTTTQANGSFGLGSEEPVGSVMARYAQLQHELAHAGVVRLATGTQVHGNAVVLHQGQWRGWLRTPQVDGHVTVTHGTALAVTVADCTPVFIAHPLGVAVLHAGWRGTAARILEVGLHAMASLGCPPDECAVHLGPAICSACYEVGPEVVEAVTGQPASGKSLLDVRAVLADRARKLQVRNVTSSAKCTRCGNGQFFSHRGGDHGRQLALIAMA